ncbi:MAG: D-2-hydroxyacid dehydrogenase [Lachnospiraceae bacterium]|nr:D-2-hydroxyacid dehydrogenase [Lachnospiraceae bacterium]
MKAVILRGALKEEHIKKIEETAAKAKVDVCFLDSEKELPEDYEDAEIAYGFGMNIAKARKLRESKSLKWVNSTSAGIEMLLKPGFFANEDVLITNSAGAYGVSIAEHIIAVTLMMFRKIDYHYAESLQGHWAEQLSQKSLKDCRITALGTGDIGRTFAKRVRAFEPESLIGVSRSGKCSEDVFDRVVPVEQLDEVLPQTELLVMSLPGTRETEGILSRERIALMPQGAYVVNVGRGSAVDEEALADALDGGKLAGAALDVFRYEPLPPKSRLWKTKGLLITPHVAGNMTLEHTVDKNVEMFCENLLNYAEGRPLKHLVDRKTGY